MPLKYYEHYKPSITTTLVTELLLFLYLFLLIFLGIFMDDFQVFLVLAIISGLYMYFLALTAVPRFFLKKKAYYYQNHFHENINLKLRQVDGPKTYCRGCGVIIDETYYRKIPLRFIYFNAKKATNIFGVKGYYCRRCFVKYSIITGIIVIMSFLAGIGTLILTFLLIGDKLDDLDFIFAILILIGYIIATFIYILTKIFQYLNYTRE